MRIAKRRPGTGGRPLGPTPPPATPPTAEEDDDKEGEVYDNDKLGGWPDWVQFPGRRGPPDNAASAEGKKAISVSPMAADLEMILDESMSQRISYFFTIMSLPVILFQF